MVRLGAANLARRPASRAGTGAARFPRTSAGSATSKRIGQFGAGRSCSRSNASSCAATRDRACSASPRSGGKSLMRPRSEWSARTAPAPEPDRGRFDPLAERRIPHRVDPPTESLERPRSGSSAASASEHPAIRVKLTSSVRRRSPIMLGDRVPVGPRRERERPIAGPPQFMNSFRRHRSGASSLQYRPQRRSGHVDLGPPAHEPNSAGTNRVAAASSCRPQTRRIVSLTGGLRDGSESSLRPRRRIGSSAGPPELLENFHEAVLRPRPPIRPATRRSATDPIVAGIPPRSAPPRRRAD